MNKAKRKELQERNESRQQCKKYNRENAKSIRHDNQRKVQAAFKKKTARKATSKRLEWKHVEPLVQYCSAPVRDPKKWESKHYNKDKQVMSFVKWIFCKYPTPEFLLELLTNKSIRYRYNDIDSIHITEGRQWAQTVASGGSLYKCAKWVFTRKECHQFLKYSSGNFLQNVWRTHCDCAHVPKRFSTQLIDRLIQEHIPIGDPFWKEFVQFMGKNHQDFDAHQFHEIIDYVRNNRLQLRTFKGRTSSSLIRMSNEWHNQIGRVRGTDIRNIQTWEGLPIEDWAIEKDPYRWYCIQLKTSVDLLREGQKQRHCVGMYSRSCANGHSGIFSLRKSFLHEDINSATREVTIEVTNEGYVFQAKRKMNKQPTAEDYNVIRNWARHNRLLFR